jgi:hypothetical protein
LRRRLAIALSLLLAAAVGFWIAARIERSGLGRSPGGGRLGRVPRVVATRPAEATPERADAATTGTVRCRLDDTNHPGRLTVRDDDGEVAVATPQGSDLVAQVEAGTYSILWRSFSTVYQVNATVEAGETWTCMLYARLFTISGRVVSPTGRPVTSATVVVCDQPIGGVDADGNFEAEVRGGFCTAQALFMDGRLARYSEAVPIRPGGEPVELVLDDAPIAGLGLTLAQRDGRVLVVEVMAGSPAAQAGMQAGDLVLEVDGHDTRDMDLVTFIGLGTGRVGTVARLLVERDGGERSFVVRRERLEDEPAGSD